MIFKNLPLRKKGFFGMMKKIRPLAGLALRLLQNLLRQQCLFPQKALYTINPKAKG